MKQCKRKVYQETGVESFNHFFKNIITLDSSARNEKIDSGF